MTIHPKERTMKGRRIILMALIALAAPGCASQLAVTPDQVTPRSDLVLTFTTPRDLTFFSETGASLPRFGVIGLRGRMIERRGDSLAIRATRVDYAIGDNQPLGAGATVAIAVADLGIQERDTHPGRTILLLAGIVLVAAIAISAATYQEPPPPPPKEEEVKVTETP
jgi:hypothetical protein